jgi:HK97 family phage major capsid protein
MTGMLKTGYNPMFFFDRMTAAFLRSLKDTQNRYLWNELFGSAVKGLPAEINGYSYTNEFIDMDSNTVANGHPILFADMKEYYQITDRTDMILIRDEYTQATQAIINFNLMRWTTGQPIKSEAAVLMTRNG